MLLAAALNPSFVAIVFAAFVPVFHNNERVVLVVLIVYLPVESEYVTVGVSPELAACIAV